MSSRPQEYLNSFVNLERDLDRVKQSEFKPERMSALLNAVGDPQKDLKIVHVAGSKGKGSTCAIMAHILKAAGYKVGLYTSPHLYDQRERIRILKTGGMNLKSTPGVDFGLGRLRTDIFDDMISEGELASVIVKIKSAVEVLRSNKGQGPLTYFEVLTAIALYHFAEQKTDIVILETGLGGRLDATNAVKTVMAVLTPISLEHAQVLGNDILQIAREKAAIIKESEQKVILSVQEKKIRNVFKGRCRRFSIQPVWAEEYALVDPVAQSATGQEFHCTTPRARYERLTLPLPGRHQRDNCATAISAAENLRGLGFNISIKAVREGVRSVFWPGRFEAIKEKPLIILDGAHNPASIKALCDLCGQLFKGKRILCVLGVSRDKNLASISEILSEITQHVIFVKADHPRANHLPGAMSVKRAVDLVLSKCGKEDVVIVTGSLFVVAEARKYLSAVNHYVNRISKIKV